MTTEILTIGSAILISVIGALFNYYKLKDDQQTWEQEQKISIEKKLLFKRLKIRHKLYHKIFTLLGYIRDIEYPKEHHLEIPNCKKDLANIADSILLELYGKSGLFMEYKTRSLILKTYQVSYKYINNESTLEELIDSYYYARRAIRSDLEFDDISGNTVKDDIVDLSNIKNKELKILKNKEKIWEIKGILAHSSRPGYPNKVVTSKILKETVDKWKEYGIQSIICLLSNKELSEYYKNINGGLLMFYKSQGFNIVHISVDDFLSPPLSKNNIQDILQHYKKLSKPVIVHCGAGEDRTGSAIHEIKEFLLSIK